MGLFASKENMDQGRECPPELSDDQQTTDEDIADSPENTRDSQEDLSDLSEDHNIPVQNAENVQLGEDGAEVFDDLYTEFLEQIEVFFLKAEDTISRNRFDLKFAKDWVLRVRDVGHRYTTKGCEESRLEDIVVKRALTTVDKIVEGVQTMQEEVLDPRHTQVYMYCSLAVFSCTLQLKKGSGRFVFHWSPAGSASLPQLTILHRYCALKTACESKGWHNMTVHMRLLFDLATWLDGEGRSAIAFLITSSSSSVISHMRQDGALLLEGMQGIRDRLERLWDLGVVLEASSIVRAGFLKEAKDYYRLLMKVDSTRLPPAMATRYSYVYARLLHNCYEFDKALYYAREALESATDPEEKREIEGLINELNDAVINAAHVRDIHGPPDEEWLEGTSAVSSDQSRRDHRDTARQNYVSRKETRQHRTRRVSFSKRGETPSPSPCRSGQGPQRSAPDLLRNTQNRSSSWTPPAARLPVCSRSPDGSGASGVEHTHGSGFPAPRESFLYSRNWDDSDEEEEEDHAGNLLQEQEIRFFYSSDEGDDDDFEASEISESSNGGMAAGLGGNEEDQHDWFEKSEQAIEQGEVDEEDGEDIGLSESQASDLERGGEGRSFYPDFHPNPGELLRSDPRRYKRCQLKIERAHKAIAKVLDKGNRYSEIIIDGRSKAGRSYMDDEVVVEVLAEPGGAAADGSMNKMAYGQVVGRLNRVNFANVEHPVFFCTLDEIEGHLMKPLCKTVPKIHVMNDTVKRKYPTLVKNRIEIKKIDADGRVHHKRFCNVRPDKREQYVFKVVLLAWRQRNIYPLGAVLDAHPGGKGYSGGLKVLSMQQRVPKMYPRTAVEDAKRIAHETLVTKGRKDLTADRLFTIDPPGSKDLDDAISIRTEGPHSIIGVHIADVAAVVKRGSGLDLEARRRAVTFYPLNRKPHCMLPEPLSHGKCSLLPDKQRLAFSVFFKFSQTGQQVGEPKLQRTVIKSQQQLTYEEVQKVLDGKESSTVKPSVQEDIRQIHTVTSKLRETRQKESVFFVPFEDPRLPELEQLNECMEAHSLIEELMILTNSYIASRLSKRPRFRDSMIVRCHKAPTYEELGEWQEKEGHVTNLVMGLQGKQITPNRQLSLNQDPVMGGNSSQPHLVVQRQIWEKLCQHLEHGEVEEARRLTFMDSLHPLQCLATNSWMDMMESAEYKCAYGLNSPDIRHFGLSLPVYTHFTSPIRRYTDLHVQRLLHADLDGRSPDCGADDVTELCQHINSATARQKAFGKGCMALKVADTLQSQPMVFRAYIDKVDDDQLTVFVPSLHKVSDRKQELSFSMLGVSSQPEVLIDTALNQQKVTVQWTRRFYDEKGTCPGSLIPVWNHHERLQNAPSHSPIVMTICPEQLSVLVKQEDWVRILKRLMSNNQRPWNTVPQSHSRSQGGVEYMSSEKGDGTVSQRPIKFQRTYTRGQIVQIQLSAAPQKGMLKPRTDILQTARNACMCTLHVSEPVLTLTRHATRATRDQQFSSQQEYLKAWMPLLEMEAAVGAGEGESAVVIDNVIATMKHQGSSELPYRGSFSLKTAFCYKRCIEFGGKSAESIRKDEYDSDMSFPLDYLCLRYKTDCSSSVVSRMKVSQVPEMVDKQYTWLAHASVVQVVHKGRKSEDGGELVVTFVLSPSSPPPPPQLLRKEGAKLTMEVLPKTEVDRRAQQLLLQLQDSDQTLARAIAFGSKFPKLNADHKKLGRKDENHEVTVLNNKRLPLNNLAQLEAIKKALTKSVTMIQGPPGSGKTNTGIKLVYLFCKINRQLQAEGKGQKTVLYCGPSNKSVDLVARELKSKLGPDKCPKIVRVYGSAIEAKDYPVPRGDLKPTRSLRDLSCDPDLQDVALHHLIRQGGKPHAEEIAEFEKFFDKCRQHPKVYSVTEKQLKAYRKLLFVASAEELQHYEVVLATCAVGGSGKVIEGTDNTVFQLIIDECAMSPEPQSMVPIIATKPEQVVLIGDHKQLRPIIKCQPAAEMGLDHSLFERLFQRFPNNTTFLNTQYRMHPKICAFPSMEFYDGGLKTGYSTLWGGELLPVWPSDPANPDRKVPHLLINVQGEEEMLTVNTDQGNERSKSNSLEADKVIEIVKFLKREYNTFPNKVDLLQVKLLTQYNAQRHLLEEKLKRAVEENRDIFEHYDKFKVKVSTVVSSQGGEWDYVILSTVRSLPSYKIEQNPTHGWCRQNLGFITDCNQVNVALTRARRGLFIVGNMELLRCDDVWRHLVERYQRQGCCIEDPSLFPPPPSRRQRQRPRHTQPNATTNWQQV